MFVIGSEQNDLLERFTSRFSAACVYQQQNKLMLILQFSSLNSADPAHLHKFAMLIDGNIHS